MNHTLPHILGAALDLGAGTRKYQPIIETNATSYTSTDIDGDVDLVADAHNLPITDNSYDTVVCVGVMEHCKRPWIVAKEIERVLRPQGKAIIAVPFMFPYHGDPNDYFRYTTEGLKSLFGGMDILEVGTYGGGVSVLETWMRIRFFSKYESHHRLTKSLGVYLSRLILAFDFLKPRDVYQMVYLVSQKRR